MVLGASVSVRGVDKEALKSSHVKVGTFTVFGSVSEIGGEADTDYTAEARGKRRPAKFVANGLSHGTLSAYEFLESFVVTVKVPEHGDKASAEKRTEGIETMAGAHGEDEACVSLTAETCKFEDREPHDSDAKHADFMDTYCTLV